MRRITLIISVLILVIVAVAIFTAMKMGEQSPVYLAGRVRLSENLKEKAKGIRTLYLVIYDTESQMPMPFGAMKENLSSDAAGSFHEFLMTKERIQLMNPRGQHVPKFFRVKARLDLDGAAGMDQPGDLTGSLAKVAFGSEELTIVIDTVK